MNKLYPLMVLGALLAGCDEKKETPPQGAKAGDTTTSTTAASASVAAKTAATSCDDVLANMEKVGGKKADDDGKKLLTAMCEAATPAVRACMAGAKTTQELDACDPHPLKGAMDDKGGKALSSTDFVEHDLSSADPVWKGWTAKGPKGAKVMADGIKGARIAADGMGAFDIVFSSTKEKLADMKKGAEAGAKAAGGSVDFKTDEADKLVWSIESSGIKTFFFAKNMKVGGKDVGCASGPMGVSKEDDIKVYEESCASLTKK